MAGKGTTALATARPALTASACRKATTLAITEGGPPRCLGVVPDLLIRRRVSLIALITRSAKDHGDLALVTLPLSREGRAWGCVEAALYGQSALLSISAAPRSERETPTNHRRRSIQSPSDVASLYRRISGVTDTPWTTTEVATTASVSPISSLADSSGTPCTIAYIR